MELALALSLMLAPGGELPIPPRDLAGVYNGFRAEGGGAYRVVVYVGDGRVWADWTCVATGRVDYRGEITLERHDDGWEYRETYLSLPGLLSCSPWPWRCVNRDPAGFEAAGWGIYRSREVQ